MQLTNKAPIPAAHFIKQGGMKSFHKEYKWNIKILPFGVFLLTFTRLYTQGIGEYLENPSGAYSSALVTAIILPTQNLGI